MKIVIIGAGGFVGKNLVRFLKQKNIEVQGFTSKEPGNIDPLTGILSDNFSIPDGTNTIIYLSQSPYYRQDMEKSSHIMNVNMVSAVRLAELSIKSKVEHFIYFSSGNVYKPSFKPLNENTPFRRDNWYSLSKIHAEEELALYKNDIKITIVRPFGIYGPGQIDKLIPNLLNSILNRKEVYIQRNPNDEYDLDGVKISLCYIDDLINILYELLFKKEISHINIAGNKVVSIREISMILSKFLKKDVSFKILDQYRNSDFIADISLLQKILNPKFTNIEDGLKKVVDYTINNKF